ncbi:MAG TPA: hypothetical protein VD886_18785 [Herpetosiphonaceae bacterium]|nr:hypothetical protein [Herpetosiphonaceae bacterium]
MTLRFVRGALLALLVGTLAGCATHLSGPFALSIAVSANFGASEPAIALAGDGTRHYAWIECANGCRLIYSRMRLNRELERLTFFPAVPGDFYRSPDIAVAESGDAYIVWRHSPDVGLAWTDYFVRVPATISGTPAPERIAPAGSLGDTAPQVVARGATVYAVYTVLRAGGDGSDLYARRLDSAAAALPVSTSPNKTIANPRAVVDSAGAIHLAFEFLGTATTFQALFYAKPADSVLTPFRSGSSSSDLYGPPDITVNAANTAYVAYGLPGASDQLSLYTRTAAGTTADTPLPLDAAADPWRLGHAPRLAFASPGLELSIAFVASNGDTPGTDEVWLYTLGAPTPLARLTSTAARESQPALVGTALSPVVAWRTVDPARPTCQTDVFAWDSAGGLRAVQAAGDSHCYRGLDLAVAGQWVGGAWVNPAPAGSPAIQGGVPWTAYGVEAVFVPLIAR